MAAAQVVSSTRIPQFFKNAMSMNIKGWGGGWGEEGWGSWSSVDQNLIPILYLSWDF